MTCLREQCRNEDSVVQLEGSLRAPVDAWLRRRVEQALGRGQRRLVIDLGRVADVDAAGVGELVHVYRMASAAKGVLRLVHATERVGTLLDRAGLLELLSGGSMLRRESCA